MADITDNKYVGVLLDFLDKHSLNPKNVAEGYRTLATSENPVEAYTEGAKGYTGKLLSKVGEYMSDPMNFVGTMGITKRLYHGTPRAFEKFDTSPKDIAIHFGTKEQAVNRARELNKQIESYGNKPNKLHLLEAELDINKILKLKNDITGRRTNEELLKDLWSEKIIDENEYFDLLKKTTPFEGGSDFYKSTMSEIKSTVDNMVKKGDISIIPKIEYNYNPTVGKTFNITTIMKNKEGEIIGKYSDSGIVNKHFPDLPNENEVTKRLLEYSKFSLMSNIEKDLSNKIFLREIEKSIQNKGYDAIQYPNKIEGEGESIGIFDPNKIKILNREIID